MIEPIADILDIPIHRVYANNLLFDSSNGKFAGFDPKELTSRDGGKAAVVKKLIDAHGYGPVGKKRFHLFGFSSAAIITASEAKLCTALCPFVVVFLLTVSYVFFLACVMFFCLSFYPVMIGDGVTDMQAKPPADLFIGFGGVVTREEVRTGADLFVTDFKAIGDLLDR